jgi:hypothetical protein
MKTFHLASALASATLVNAATFCSLLDASTLPSICNCVDDDAGLTLTCAQALKVPNPIPLSDPLIDTTISFIFEVKPCAEVASAKLEVKSTQPQIDFPYTVVVSKRGAHHCNCCCCCCCCC